MTGTAANARIYLVAAVAANGVIGAQGKLPWRLPEDLQHFKRLTVGHAVIMGRRTWESIGKALPARYNIVLTRSRHYSAPGARIACSLDEALAQCAADNIAFVIGGVELYREALPRAAGLFLTELKDAYEGDAHFPPIDRGAWKELGREPRVAANGIRFDFVQYERAGGAGAQ